jgi:hypothetical protein
MKCLICQSELNNAITNVEPHLFDCPKCGRFRLEYEAVSDLPFYLKSKKNAAQIISHVLRKMQAKENKPLISTELLSSILDQVEPPKPNEQLDYFIDWLGANQESPGHAVEIKDELDAVIGARDKLDVGFVVEYAIESGLVEGKVVRSVSNDPVFLPVHLTFKGWDYWQQLRKGAISGNRAFMAMPFNDPLLDDFFENYLKHAVGETGFDLRRLDDQQKAGLIDDHLRVEIRQSKLLIAELTNNNNGAYWEAGYAEGLGIPVIYTCNKNFFDSHKTHFDTNHHLTIIWDSNDIQGAMKKLKDTIRATLPDQATFEI